MHSPVPIRSPRSGGTLLAPLALRPGLFQEEKMRTKEITKEMANKMATPRQRTP